MLLSMTGFGDSRHQDDRLAVSVEVRTVNNRYLKITTKCSDSYAAFEGDIEKIVRELISRGTVNVFVRVDRLRTDEDYQLNQGALKSYWTQLQKACTDLQLKPTEAAMTSILTLPGVVADTQRRSFNIDGDWVVIERLLRESLGKLQLFRAEEGRSMERDLVLNVKIIGERLQEVVALAPQVVSEYRVKLLERVRQLLQESDVHVSDSDLIREVSIFSERSDINEEITRLKCHLEQFDAFIREPASAGRKLDFLTQEMFREVNTIGSKANNVAIAHSVVEMKAAVEKIREVLQNVE